MTFGIDRARRLIERKNAAAATYSCSTTRVPRINSASQDIERFPEPLRHNGSASGRRPRIAVAGVAIAALGIYKSKKEALGAEGNEAQWLVLVRHGDRQDYAQRRRGGPASRPSGATREDPPLSTLGHRQARQLGAAAAARRGARCAAQERRSITPLCA